MQFMFKDKLNMLSTHLLYDLEHNAHEEKIKKTASDF